MGGDGGVAAEVRVEGGEGWGENVKLIVRV